MSAHRVYTVAQLLDLLALSRSTFFDLKRRGRLPMVEELRPRLGRSPRYRAEPVERWLAGQWGGPKAFRRAS
jgi:predicted DNA-binding transcriptional regulator AlpA